MICMCVRERATEKRREAESLDTLLVAGMCVCVMMYAYVEREGGREREREKGGEDVCSV